MLTPWFLKGRRVHSLVKSVQAVSVSASGPSNIATLAIPVDTSNCILFFAEMSVSTGGAVVDAAIYAQLTSSTTVTFTHTSAGVNSTGYATVVEFWPGVIRSVQRGTVTISGTNGSGTATISAVGATAFVNMTGFDTNLSTVDTFTSVVLTNSTTVTAQRGNGGAVTSSTSIAAFEVVEFY